MRSASEIEHAVDVDLAALGSVEGWAEVDWGTLESCGGGEGCEGCEGEGGELHFWWVGIVVRGLEDGMGCGLDEMMEDDDTYTVLLAPGCLAVCYE
jgi:hypothetical protein